MSITASTPVDTRGPRGLAAGAITSVLRDGRSLNRCLEEALVELGDPRDRALVRELSFGVVRWLPRLQLTLDALVERPLRAKHTPVRVALLLGLYQLLYTRVPEHAAVNESVALVHRAGKGWATGLVNGVLRSFLRRRERILARVDVSEEGRLAHPGWIIDATRDTWRDDWQHILESNNERPPMALRVNALQKSRDAYLEALRENGIASSRVEHTEFGVLMDRPRDVTILPGFDDGLVSVQDGAAQLAAGLLDPRPGMRVLDACAAPGGKTAHLLEYERDIAHMVAVDCERARLERVEHNLDRLGLEAELVCDDACDTARWWDGEAFDRILVDAPCSGFGVMRRHPDIKLHRRPGDIDALVDTQSRLLESLWPLLADQGLLLYATCSYLPRENDQVIEQFLANRSDALGTPLKRAWGRTTVHGRQVLPGENAMDGFYYALLGKR